MDDIIIPIKLIDGQIKVECEIYSVDNSYSKNFYLVVDTGATRSGISENIAIDLGYDPLQPDDFQEFNTAGGIETLPLITLRNVYVYKVKIKEYSVVCNKHFDDQFIDGVLGLDFLSCYNLEIKFDDYLIRLSEKKKKFITP